MNERVRVCDYVGVLLCCGGVRGYTHAHISFDLRVFVYCDVRDEACTHTHKEDSCE